MIKTILITGCSHGLGHALALKFAEDGLTVYAVGRNSQALTELAKLSSNIKPIVADITDPHDRVIIQQQIAQEKSPISIIHNAASANPAQFNLIQEDSIRKDMETNYLAPLILTQQLLPLISSGQRILNITSGAAKTPISGLISYCSSKAAMHLAIECLNQELSPQGIHCANLGPGMIDTPMQLKLRTTDEKILPGSKFYTRSKEENKLIQPEVVSEFVAWVMLKTEDTDFSKTAWNIYDETQQEHWLTKNLVKPVRP